MFTKGQVIFAILFVIAFVFFVVRSYRKDRNFHRKNFKGVRWIALTFLAFVILLFVIKYLLNK